MKITGSVETIQADPLVTGPIEDIVVECEDYAAGLAAMRRTLPEGQRLLNVRIED